MEEQTRRVSFEQMAVMMDFMGQHKELATGVQRTTEARHLFKKQWSELAKTLNGVRGGTKKTPDLWSRYWSDFKNKLKKKVKMLDRRRHQGLCSSNMKSLTKLEKRALIILGPKFSKVSRDRNTRLCSSKHVPAEVKLENFEDSDCQEPSETSDRLSDGEGDNDHIAESDPEENGIEFEEAISESTIQNIYPKWLIEVEKQRATAELSRARSEEHRASMAVQHADAAVTQAEALKRLSEATVMQAEALKQLSEAATTQANALMRIALFLENKEHSTFNS